MALSAARCRNAHFVEHQKRCVNENWKCRWERPRDPDDMVGAAGIEPATLGLEIRCSIRLSYAPALINTGEEAHCRNLRSLIAMPAVRIAHPTRPLSCRSLPRQDQSRVEEHAVQPRCHSLPIKSVEAKPGRSAWYDRHSDFTALNASSSLVASEWHQFPAKKLCLADSIGLRSMVTRGFRSAQPTPSSSEVSSAKIARSI